MPLQPALATPLAPPCCGPTSEAHQPWRMRPGLLPSVMQLWSFDGQRLASLAHAVLPDAAAINSVYISEAQDLAFIYCRPGPSSRGGEQATANAATAEEGAAAEADAADAAAAASAGAEAHGGNGQGRDSTALGCIRVYSLLTGHQVAWIQQQRAQQEQRQGVPGGGGRQARMAAAGAAALKHVTSLLFDEHTNRLYTGTADGRLQSWGVG